MRRGALSRRGRARRRLGLPLPHVPEGVRQFLPAAGLGARRQAHLDARRSRRNSSRRTSPAAASAAIAARRSPTRRRTASRCRSPPSTNRRRSCRRSSGDRGQAPLRRRDPRAAWQETLEDDAARRASLHELVSYQHPDYDTETWPPEASQMSESFPGGCQCGAVRFRAGRLTDNAHICHCRMCQKAVGNFFAALVGAPKEAVTWTRGKPSVFRSLGACRARLLQRVRHAAFLSRLERAAHHADHRLLRPSASA